MRALDKFVGLGPPALPFLPIVVPTARKWAFAQVLPGKEDRWHEFKEIFSIDSQNLKKKIFKYGQKFLAAVWNTLEPGEEFTLFLGARENKATGNATWMGFPVSGSSDLLRDFESMLREAGRSVFPPVLGNSVELHLDRVSVDPKYFRFGEDQGEVHSR